MALNRIIIWPLRGKLQQPLFGVGGPPAATLPWSRTNPRSQPKVVHFLLQPQIGPPADQPWVNVAVQSTILASWQPDSWQQPWRVSIATIQPSVSWRNVSVLAEILASWQAQDWRQTPQSKRTPDSVDNPPGKRPDSFINTWWQDSWIPQQARPSAIVGFPRIDDPPFGFRASAPPHAWNAESWRVAPISQIVQPFLSQVDDPPLGDRRRRIALQAAIIASWYRWRPSGAVGGAGPPPTGSVIQALISISLGMRIG